jgi:hypothetical protein
LNGINHRCPHLKDFFGKNFEEKFEKIEKAYELSFYDDLFNIDFDNLDSNIYKIKTNLKKRSSVDDTTFNDLNRKTQNGIPSAIIHKFIKFLEEQYQNTDEINKLNK